jgi:hypothetical protein
MNFHHDNLYVTLPQHRKEGHPRMPCSKPHGSNNRLNGTPPEPKELKKLVTKEAKVATKEAWDQTNYERILPIVPGNKKVKDRAPNGNALPEMLPKLNRQ